VWFKSTRPDSLRFIDSLHDVWTNPVPVTVPKLATHSSTQAQTPAPQNDYESAS